VGDSLCCHPQNLFISTKMMKHTQLIRCWREKTVIQKWHTLEWSSRIFNKHNKTGSQRNWKRRTKARADRKFLKSWKPEGK
jgi:hypothetical protein